MTWRFTARARRLPGGLGLCVPSVTCCLEPTKCLEMTLKYILQWVLQPTGASIYHASTTWEKVDWKDFSHAAFCQKAHVLPMGP